MIKGKENLIDFLDSVFVLGGEMIKDNGEDCYAYSVKENKAVIAVFDGCGGIGSRKYEAYANKTGAYIASHFLARKAVDCFKDWCEIGADFSAQRICGDLKMSFTEELKRLEGGTTVSAIKGSLTKSFPTTASMIFLENTGRNVTSSFVWAGDSRGFVLRLGGLTQVTVDDIDEGEDALSNLSSDSRLTNVITATGDYHLNCKTIVNDEPSILITATDGCFGYFSTPMEFEYMLLTTMAEAENIKDWKAKLEKYILKYTGDDYTIGMAIFGFKSFKLMKKVFASRKALMQKEYILPLEKASEEQKMVLWQKYQKDYYRSV